MAAFSELKHAYSLLTNNFIYYRELNQEAAGVIKCVLKTPESHVACHAPFLMESTLSILSYDVHKLNE